MDAQERPRLILEYQGHVIQLVADTEEHVHLGKDSACDLTYDAEFASRKHAYLECRNNDFYLVDQSTNGSFVQTEDEQVAHVHRAAIRLWGAGYIGLGEPLHSASPIVFRQG